MKNGVIRIMLVDDHELLRMGLRSLLRYEKDIVLVGEARNGEEALRVAGETHPDMVLMDLVMPGMSGAETTRRLCAEHENIRILILTSFGTTVEVAEAIRNGAQGAITKDTPGGELPGIIRRVAAGERVFSPEIEQSIAEIPSPLTPRQIEVLSFAARGFTSAEIAKQLGISPDAVNQHLTIVCEKLGAANRVEAASIAVSRHIVSV